MKRAITASAAAAMLIGCLGVGSASAAAVEGSCAPPFTEVSLAGLQEEFPELFEAYGEEAMAYVFTGIDANANGEVCAMGHPAQSATPVDKSLLVNLVDDTAAPHD